MKTIIFFSNLALFLSFSFFLIWIYSKFLDKKIKKQKKFLFVVSERTKTLLNEHGPDQASRFIKRNAPAIFRLHEDAFDDRFRKIERFIDHIGDDYTDEENLMFLLEEKYKEEDVEDLAKEFLSLVSENQNTVQTLA
jgi:hypothetical protein